MPLVKALCYLITFQAFVLDPGKELGSALILRCAGSRPAGRCFHLVAPHHPPLNEKVAGDVAAAVVVGCQWAQVARSASMSVGSVMSVGSGQLASETDRYVVNVAFCYVFFFVFFAIKT